MFLNSLAVIAIAFAILSLFAAVKADNESYGTVIHYPQAWVVPAGVIGVLWLVFG